MRNVSLAVCLVLGGCPSTQSTAPPPVASTADPKQEPPVPAVPAAPEARPSPAPAASAKVSRPSDGAGKWTFDAERADGSPSGFSFGKTGSGKPGRWVVHSAADAPSAPNVLA